MDSYLQNLFRAYDASPQDIDVAGKLIAALRRIHNGESVSYKLRNLPCNIVDDDHLWAVSGGFDDGRERSGGVLEWCYDEEDANNILSMMQLDPRYSDLRAHKWEPHGLQPEQAADLHALHGVNSGYNGPIPWDEMTQELWDEHYG
jgi:hypothetical protein